MGRLLLFSAIFTTLILSSCGKGLTTNQIQDRLIGTWDIDRVEFRDKGTMFRKDVTGNWSNYRMEFFVDGTMDWIDKSSSDTLFGYWYINESLEWNSNSQSNDVVQKLELYVYDAAFIDYKFFKWEDLGITNSKLRAEESTAKGRYFYKLKKI